MFTAFLSRICQECCLHLIHERDEPRARWKQTNRLVIRRQQGGREGHHTVMRVRSIDRLLEHAAGPPSADPRISFTLQTLPRKRTSLSLLSVCARPFITRRGRRRPARR